MRELFDRPVLEYGSGRGLAVVTHRVTFCRDSKTVQQTIRVIEVSHDLVHFEDLTVVAVCRTERVDVAVLHAAHAHCEFCRVIQKRKLFTRKYALWLALCNAA